MRQILLTSSLILSLGIAACADHSGSLIALESPNSPPPISNGGDEGNIVNPVQPATSNSEAPAPGGSNGFTQGGSGTGAASGVGGGNPPQGGSPVPEPGTMLLVGTGLAGAALMRRRRQTVEAQVQADSQ